MRIVRYPVSFLFWQMIDASSDTRMDAYFVGVDVLDDPQVSMPVRVYFVGADVPDSPSCINYLFAI